MSEAYALSSESRKGGASVEPELGKRLVDGLKAAGIDFITYLPETRLSQMIPYFEADESFFSLRVANEAEAITVAAGAAFGGRQAAVYMEGTGVFVSTYSLLTVGERFNVPMLLLVAYVGSAQDKRNSFLFAHYGVKLTPLLDALGIQWRIIESGETVESEIRDAVRTMHAFKLPFALLFTGEFTR